MACRIRQQPFTNGERERATKTNEGKRGTEIVIIKSVCVGSTAPASKPVITDAKGIEMRNVSGLYDRGTSLTLICTVTQGTSHYFLLSFFEIMFRMDLFGYCRPIRLFQSSWPNGPTSNRKTLFLSTCGTGYSRNRPDRQVTKVERTWQCQSTTLHYQERGNSMEEWFRIHHHIQLCGRVDGMPSIQKANLQLHQGDKFIKKSSKPYCMWTDVRCQEKLSRIDVTFSIETDSKASIWHKIGTITIKVVLTMEDKKGKKDD